MDDSGWLKVAAEIPSHAEEAFLSILSDFSTSGVEVLGAEAKPLYPSLSDLPDGWVRIGVYCQEPERLAVEDAVDAAIQKLQSEHRVSNAARRFHTEVIPEGWRDRWKSFFHVTRVTDRVVIRPTWEHYQPLPGDCIIDMDPGAAFGTGGHATTRLCLQTLDGILPVATLLDVGTGSGVLSIGAAKLGVRHVRATDNDILAVEVARENVASNALWDRIVVDDSPLERIEDRYEVVVANIIAPVLVTLSGDLVRCTAPGGHLILSGILTEESDRLSRCFVDLGATEQGRTTENGWTCLHLRMPAA